eukprot:gene13606-28903_t
MLPPLLVGGAMVWRLKRGIRPQIAFVLLSTALAVALFRFAPSWLGRYLGLRDVEILGTFVMWSPLGWICAAATAFMTTGCPAPFDAWRLRHYAARSSR